MTLDRAGTVCPLAAAFCLTLDRDERAGSIHSGAKRDGPSRRPRLAAIDPILGLA
jgi:hypothetical protein